MQRGNSLPHVEHFPARKIEISQLMFNEIFINPKLEKLNKLEVEQQKQRNLTMGKIQPNMSLPNIKH